jgi:tetratricopeptide (TPR) repeat protein
MLQRAQRRAHAVIPKAKLESGDEVWVLASRPWTVDEAIRSPQLQGCSRVAWSHADLGANCKIELHVLDQPAKKVIWEGVFDRPRSDIAGLLVVMARTLDATLLPARPSTSNEMWSKQLPSQNAECLWNLLTAIDFQEALQLNIKLGDPTPAFDAMRAAMAADPNCLFASSVLMGSAIRWVASKKGDPELAMSLLRETAAAREDLYRMTAALAECELQVDQNDAALQHARQYLQRAKEVERAHAEEMIGRIHEKTGDIVQATSAFRRAVQIDPKRLVSWHQLGYIAAQMFQWEEAETCYAKCAELAPGNAEIQEKLKIVRGELERSRHAQGGKPTL